MPVALRKGLPSTRTNVKGTDSPDMKSAEINSVDLCTIGFFSATVLLLVIILLILYNHNMLGPTVNALAIVVCGLVGCFLLRGIPSRFEDIIKKAIGLSVFFIGIRGALDSQNILLLILSMVCGAAIGEFIGIDSLLNRLGHWVEKRLGIKGDANGRSFSKGFVTASILFCGGSMAIVGSMQSGLLGNHEVLFSKSVIDGAVSIIFAASMGIGVVFSAIPVFVYQSFIVLTSIAIRDFLTAEIIREMSSVGSLIVAAIGYTLFSGKEIKVANFIPAIFIPFIYLIIEGFIRG